MGVIPSAAGLTWTRWYHGVSRCVRKAFLLGEGDQNRRLWLEKRLDELGETFAVAVGGFSVDRFKSVAVVGEKALLRICVYIDLNPVAAKVAKTPETSDFAGLKPRRQSNLLAESRSGQFRVEPCRDCDEMKKADAMPCLRFSPLDAHLHQAITLKKLKTHLRIWLFAGTSYFRVVTVVRLLPSGSQVIKYAFRSTTSSGCRSGICQV